MKHAFGRELGEASVDLLGVGDVEVVPGQIGREIPGRWGPGTEVAGVDLVASLEQSADQVEPDLTTGTSHQGPHARESPHSLGRKQAARHAQTHAEGADRGMGKVMRSRASWPHTMTAVGEFLRSTAMLCQG
jgi:hypothetical protein